MGPCALSLRGGSWASVMSGLKSGDTSAPEGEESRWVHAGPGGSWGESRPREGQQGEEER